ncbi:MAG: glycosyltransferase family 61 protein [Bacteroidetes bacterium]|nr:glycosyltransferase family 61 protein [Bacteroidota bacterium]
MKIKFYDELETIILREKDQNDRSIRYNTINDCVITGYDSFYPNAIIKSDDYDFLILPIKEDFMSLKSGTVYEKDMSFDYQNNNTKFNKIDTPAFFFICNTTNYYHFIYDSIPYLFTYFELKKKIPDLKLLMNYSDVSKTTFFPFVLETLEVLGIKLEDITIHNELNKYHTIYIGSSLTHDKKPNTPPRKEIYDLFQRMADSVNLDHNTPKKIYVSRRTWIHNDLSNIGTDYTTRRKLMNEDKLVEYLESIGYKEVFCEKMSMKEKIHLFRNAEYIAGPIGGGMCNILFSKPSAKVFSIISPTFLEVNERFLFSMNNCDLENINDSDFYKSEGDIKNGVRVKIKNQNTIGEVKEYLGNNLYKVVMRKLGTTGSESTDELEEVKLHESEIDPIDAGLNSPWIVDLDKIKQTII